VREYNTGMHDDDTTVGKIPIGNERRTEELRIPLTVAERNLIEVATRGHAIEWARLALLAAAKKQVSK